MFLFVKISIQIILLSNIPLYKTIMKFCQKVTHYKFDIHLIVQRWYVHALKLIISFALESWYDAQSTHMPKIDLNARITRPIVPATRIIEELIKRKWDISRRVFFSLHPANAVSVLLTRVQLNEIMRTALHISLVYICKKKKKKKKKKIAQIMVLQLGPHANYSWACCIQAVWKSKRCARRTSARQTSFFHSFFQKKKKNFFFIPRWMSVPIKRSRILRNQMHWTERLNS